MQGKIKVILITDGDRVAQHVIEEIGAELGLRCISASAGNPTPINGKQIVELIKQVPYDPVLVMFDDRGRKDKGNGEQALEYVANHPEIEVIGAVAVASNTTGIDGVSVDACIDRDCHLVDAPVDKNGAAKPKSTDNPLIFGDTVDVLNDISIPVIIGVGDIGKMDKNDDLTKGAPVTKKAIEEILKRSGVQYGGKNKGK